MLISIIVISAEAVVSSSGGMLFMRISVRLHFACRNIVKRDPSIGIARCTIWDVIGEGSERRSSVAVSIPLQLQLHPWG